MKKFEQGASLYEDNYWGRVRDSIKLYDFMSLKYSDEELKSMNEEIKEYVKTGITKRTNEELWDMYYVVKGNLHPETEKPVTKVFRWSGFVPTNIPIIVGISCLPPTPLNQMFFQSLNQSYNFGLNFCNSSANNLKSKNELLISYLAAVSASIAGSAGLRQLITKMNLKGAFGRSMLTMTPFFGLVFASSVNLFFSRSKELSDGLPVQDPATNQPIEDLPSQIAAKSAFMESWLIRILIPIPLFLGPMTASRLATKHFKFYQKTIPKLAFDATVVGLSLWGSLIFVMSGFTNTGYLKLNKLEPRIQERLKSYPPETTIKFAKGL